VKDLDKELLRLGYEKTDWDKMNAKGGFRSKLWSLYWRYAKFFTKMSFPEFVERYKTERAKLKEAEDAGTKKGTS
jgi:hypothetical protein